MTSEAEARAKVRAYLKTDDFELKEFPEGWRVVLPIPRDLVGTTTLAVERATGSIVEFPSSVPPTRVSEHYNAVRPRGWTVEQASD